MPATFDVQGGNATITITWSGNATKLSRTVDHAVRQLQSQGFSGLVGVDLNTATNLQKLNILADYLREHSSGLARVYYVNNQVSVARNDAEGQVNTEVGL